MEDMYCIPVIPYVSKHEYVRLFCLKVLRVKATVLGRA
jgi:hypothetical protein